MIELMLALLQESPLLFTVMIINLVIVAYIIFRISLHLLHKKKPGKAISHFIWKIKARKESGEIKTIEEVYAFVIDSLKKDGVLGKDDKGGLLARKRALNVMPDGEKKQLLKDLFGLYEAKAYGNRRVANEARIISDFLSRYTDI